MNHTANFIASQGLLMCTDPAFQLNTNLSLRSM